MTEESGPSCIANPSQAEWPHEGELFVNGDHGAHHYIECFRRNLSSLSLNIEYFLRFSTCIGEKSLAGAFEIGNCIALPIAALTTPRLSAFVGGVFLPFQT